MFSAPIDGKCSLYQYKQMFLGVA